MKKILSILILLFLSLTQFGIAQITRGGSEKNYDRFRIKYDTIVSERKVLQDASIINPSSNYSSLQVGFARGMGYSTGLPSALEYTNSPYFAAPIESGELGLGNGFSLQFENQSGFNQINKNLIRMIDVHGRFGMGYTNLGQDWSSIYARSNFQDGSTEDFYNELLESGTYNSYHIINFGYGIGVTVYPSKEMKNLAFDLTFGANFNAIFGGMASLSYEQTNPVDLTTEEYTIEISDYDGGSLGFSNYLRLGIRYSNFMFFIQPNFGINLIDLSSTDDSIEEYIEYEITGPPGSGFFDFSSGESSFDRSGRTRLNNFQIGIGITF
jgi:hypothetical protein